MAPFRKLRIATPVSSLSMRRVERGGLRAHARHRPHEPLDHVHVVARLVHERAAVEFPRAAPRRRVIVLLRPVPAHGGVREIDATEAPRGRASAWSSGYRRDSNGSVSPRTGARCAASQACTSASASSSRVAIGFSDEHVHPPLRGEDAVPRGCSPLGVQMIAMSAGTLLQHSSCSLLEVRVRSYSPPRCCARSATVSHTATSCSAGLRGDRIEVALADAPTFYYHHTESRAWPASMRSRDPFPPPWRSGSRPRSFAKRRTRV